MRATDPSAFFIIGTAVMQDIHTTISNTGKTSIKSLKNPINNTYGHKRYHLRKSNPYATGGYFGQYKIMQQILKKD